MNKSLRMVRGAGAALLLVTGCVQVLGLHDRNTAGGDAGAIDIAASANPVAGQCGQVLHTSTSCASCMDTSCCAESRACAADAACVEAQDCLADCTDAVCEARCAVFYSQPDTLLALRSCRVRQCASACSSTCGEFASPVTACQACMQATCCSQGTACAADVSCAQIQRCVSNCFGATSCPTDCQAAHPQGTADFTGIYGCSDQCAAQCQPSQSWSCLDSPILWPKPKTTATISFSITFVDFAAEQPFVGATVKACGKLDFMCTSPITQSMTDATGLVSLTVPAGLSGFDGYLDVSGGKLNGSGSSTYPAIWYPLPYIVSDGWRGRTTILSSDELPQFAAATNTTLDPTRGHFASNAVDCAFTPASGVSFSAMGADSQTRAFYLVNGVPATSSTATDQSGIGGFINLPAGPPTMPSAHLVVIQAVSQTAGGKSMGAQSFIIRPGTVTTTSEYPPIP